MGKKGGKHEAEAVDELSQRLQWAVEAEVKRLTEWSNQGKKPHTLGEMEQEVLGVLRRLGPELMEGLIESEAEKAALSPPVRMRRADEGVARAAQADADADG